MTENREQKTEAPGASREFTALSRRQKPDDWVAAFSPKAKGMAEHRGPRQVGASLRSACENCEHSVPAGPSPLPTLICNHKAGSDLPWQVVELDDCCANFEQARELVPPDITAALAEGAKLLPLSQGKFAIVDAEDYDQLSQYKWTAAKSPNTFYAVRSVRGRQIRMHRLITNAPKGLVVDHRDHNGLNNRKENLRLCIRSENARNQRPQAGRSSKYKGVCWHKTQKRWHARVHSNGVTYHLGSFKSEIEAAKAYSKKARELYGQFAHLNFPKDSS